MSGDVPPISLYVCMTSIRTTIPFTESGFVMYTISDLRLEIVPSAGKSDTLCKAIASLGKRSQLSVSLCWPVTSCASPGVDQHHNQYISLRNTFLAAKTKYPQTSH
jgi:hypothetical protein